MACLFSISNGLWALELDDNHSSPSKHPAALYESLLDTRSLMPSSFEVTIRPHRGWQPIDLREIWLYRELLVFLVWRDIKIRYRQTLLGALWAVLQPLIAMMIFTFIFNRLAGVKSDGPPYPLFALAGLAPWTFFSTAVSQSSNSLVSNWSRKFIFPVSSFRSAQSARCCWISD